MHWINWLVVVVYLVVVVGDSLRRTRGTKNLHGGPWG
jgi:SSS family solute:Na+ symporter